MRSIYITFTIEFRRVKSDDSERKFKRWLTLTECGFIILTMGKVFVLGSINTDLVTYVDRLPERGETITGGRFSVFAGGKGANQAIAASRAGSDVVMFGAVGDDSYGRERLRDLERDGVDISGVVIKDRVHSGIAQIIVDSSGENIIAVAPGANFEFSPSDVRLSKADSPVGAGNGTGFDVALFQNELKQTVTEELIRSVHSLGFCIVWNIAPAFVNPPSEETLKCVHYLVCNEVELGGLLAILLGKGNEGFLVEQEGIELDKVKKSARELLERGVKNVVVTLGSKGSVLVNSDGSSIYQEAYKVTPVDTVGAGDCFVGVFAASLAAGSTPEEALKYSSGAAALSVTREGAQASMPTLDEINNFLNIS